MRGLEVIRPGLRTTVEDLGRRGVAPWGVPPGGAFDRAALEAANLLVGNPPEAAGLELTLRGPELVAGEDLEVAYVGVDFDARLASGAEERPLPFGRAVEVRRGTSLRFGYARGGARAWLAVGGGVEVPAIFGSRSTDVPSRFGGLGGRPLRPGDDLPVGPQLWRGSRAAYRDPVSVPANGPALLRVLPGPQLPLMPEDWMGAFERALFRVGVDSDRTGVRLTLVSGELPKGGPAEIEPEGTTLGSVQLAGETPIALGPDRPTTGGYPKPAAVISADAGLLARLAPGMAVSFRAVTREEALRAAAELAAAREGLRQ